MPVSKLKTREGSAIAEIPLWTDVRTVESQALDQLRNIASLPRVVHMAVMPDVHLGKGATVGSVIATEGAISPAAVGVDIGCGMGAICTNLDIRKVTRRAAKIRSAIEAAVPVGFNSHSSTVVNSLTGQLKEDALGILGEFKSLTEEVRKELDRAANQLGTLGGGNHFIEINADEQNRIWIMLHSGSRWIGNALATVHMKAAMALEHNVGICDKALSYFLSGTPEMEAYRRDLYWAQQYALINRRIMMTLCWDALRKFFPGIKVVGEPVWCHHNYVAEEIHYDKQLFVTRKGAINAERGMMGIIPGAMGRCSYIVRGKGCEEALRSAPHGAGRKMSRSKAKQKFTMEDLLKQTKGVECRKDKGILDELPASYKKIEDVIHYSSDLVEVVTELQPALICIKG